MIVPVSVSNRSEIVAVPTPRGMVEVCRQQWRSQAPNAPWELVWVARRKGQAGWRRGASAAEAIRSATLLPPKKKKPWLAAAAAQAERVLDV